ncbi:MAG TPA: cytochrome c oxidase assembly protein [Gaiellaceae bacterium]|nr:cytochrome c oxidase assembly protein [Gaiellaceae bacterium]
MSALTGSGDWPLGVPFVVCVALVALYAVGGRGRREDHRRSAAFYLGVAVVALALDTPIDAYADKLFAVHMFQHVLLLTVAPPLLVLGHAWPRLWRPLPLAVRRTAARAFVVGAPLARPSVALLLLAANLGAWHVPALYDATLRNDHVHQLEHLTFVLTGILFWAPLLGAPPLRERLDGARRCLYLVLALVPGWILAIVLAFARTPLYAYPTGRRPLGLSMISDQQLAAGVMWVPGSLVYAAAACWALYSWLDPAGSQRAHRPAFPSSSP